MQRTFIGGALILLLFSALLSTWTAYDLNLGLPLLLTMLMSVALFFAIVKLDIPPHFVAQGLVGVAFLGAFYFVAQYGHFHYPLETGTPARFGRITGSLLPNMLFFTPHPNAVAAFLAGAFPISLLLIGQTQGRKRFLWSGATLLIAYSLFISGSRGAWVGLAVAFALWLLLLIPNGWLRLTLAGLGLGVILLSLYALPRLGPIPLLTSTLETANSRLILYQNSLNLLGDYPFTGIGLGDAFGLVYSRYQLLIPVPFLTYSHNLFLSVALSLGLLGLIALLWLLIAFYSFVIRVEYSDTLASPHLPMFRAAWLGVTATFVHGLTDAPQFSGMGWPMPMLFVLLGLAVIAGRPVLDQAQQSHYRRGTPQKHYKRWAALALVLIMLMAGFSFLFRQSLLSSWYANMGAVYQTRADLAPALSDTERTSLTRQASAYFKQALSFNPAHPVANRRSGLIALEQQTFDTATHYLSQAYAQEPNNQATLKGLGYAYLWTGHLNQAEEILQQLDSQSELLEELGNWRTWWGSQSREDLAAYADEMTQRLATRVEN